MIVDIILFLLFAGAVYWWEGSFARHQSQVCVVILLRNCWNPIHKVTGLGLR